MLVPELSNANIDANSPWLRFQAWGSDGERLGRDKPVMFEQGVELRKRNNWNELIVAQPELLGLTEWQWKSAVVLRSLPRGDYKFGAILPSEVYPFALVEQRVKKGLEIVKLDVGNPAFVGVKFGGIPEWLGNRLKTNKAWLALRNSKVSKSCAISQLYWNLGVLQTGMCVQLPSDMEGWLVLELPNEAGRGNGYELRPFKISEESDVVLELKAGLSSDHDGKPLPSWVRTHPEE